MVGAGCRGLWVRRRSYRRSSSTKPTTLNRVDRPRTAPQVVPAARLSFTPTHAHLSRPASQSVYGQLQAHVGDCTDGRAAPMLVRWPKPQRTDHFDGVALARIRRDSGLMSLDPVASNPNHYAVVFENDRVRVLEYTDNPGDKTTPHEHPDSVMDTLSAFRRRLHSSDAHRDVDLPAGMTSWLPAQQHSGENIGDTPTRVLFVELKNGGGSAAGDVLGPQ